MWDSEIANAPVLTVGECGRDCFSVDSDRLNAWISPGLPVEEWRRCSAATESARFLTVVL